jgi:RNA polymerase sigma-54 factor
MIIQSQSQTIRPMTTAHLAQTMTLLELTSAELGQKIEAELASNPALELIEIRTCPNCNRRLPERGPCPVCSRPPKTEPEQPIIFISPREDFRQYSSGVRSGDEMPDEEWTAAVEDLPSFILRQIATELEPEERPLAAHILTSLDDDGLLPISITEIALYHHVRLAQVERVVRLIQRAEPVGVGSSTPQQALLVQLDVLAETGQVPELAVEAIQKSMDLLSRHAYLELGRRLKVSTKQAQSIARFISENLNPYPARAHWGDQRHVTAPRTVYQTPDVLISRLNERSDTPLVVEIISPYAGRLRVNPLFRDALSEAPDDKTEQWQADIEQANLLVKCLQQRNHTLVRLMARMVVLQRRFLLKGDAHLVPVTRARIADELGVHESTVSRAVSGKALQLPNGRIISISKLFDRSLHVRTALRDIVETEPKPLSDTQIAKLLSERGYLVARRTVAKYRTMEGILPARLRVAHPR